jgi:hypothetical protein
MGRSQVLYNQRAGRTRAARGGGRGGGGGGGGRGGSGGDRGGGQRAETSHHHRVVDNVSQESTVDRGEAAHSSGRDVEPFQRRQQQQNTSDLEADHLLSLSSATSIYASQIPVEKSRSALETPTFLTSPAGNATNSTTKTANVQALCSRMSRSLETLPKSLILRMPDHLLATIYGTTSTRTPAASLPQSTVGLEPQSTAIPLPTSVRQSGRVAESMSTNDDPRHGRREPLQRQPVHGVPVTDLTAVTTILGDDEDEMDTKSNNNHDGVVYLGTKNASHAPITVDDADLDSWLDGVIS